MRDWEVRQALHRKVLREHHSDPDTLVLEELGLRHGACRVDVAVINGAIHGFEIKSDSDTLDRLPSQAQAYGAVLDRATLVAGVKHVERAMLMIPIWWGVRVATPGPRGGIEFPVVRRNRQNSAISAVAVAELLWRPEVIDALSGRGVPFRLMRKPRADLYRLLAETTPLSELRDLVRQRLKSRERWRGQRPPLSYAGC